MNLGFETSIGEWVIRDAPISGVKSFDTSFGKFSSIRKKI